MTLLSKYIFHDVIFGKVGFLAGKRSNNLRSDGAEVPTVGDDDFYNEKNNIINEIKLIVKKLEPHVKVIEKLDNINFVFEYYLT